MTLTEAYIREFEKFRQATPPTPKPAAPGAVQNALTGVAPGTYTRERKEPSMALMPICKSCKFYHIAEPQYVYGDCRRLPPIPDFSFSIKPGKWGEGGEGSISRRAQPIFPNVHEDLWCGEHQTAE